MVNFFTILYIALFFFGIFFILIFLLLHYRNKDRLYESPPYKTIPSLTILVPAYNEEKSIENTLTALLNLDYPKDKLKIIVINDGSFDATQEIAEKFTKKNKIIIVINKKNSGKANSLNEALRLITSELVAVVDADSYPQEDACKKMIGHFQDVNVAAVTSRVLVKNKTNWLARFQVLDYSIIAWTRKLLDFVDSVYVTNGPLSMYRTSVAKSIGGFDPSNLTEDIEITWHMLNQGYNTRMSYNAIVYTTVPENIKTWIKQRIRWNLGGLQTVQKYYKTMFKKGAFGYFVIPYVSASFFFAVVGFLLLVRFFWIKGSYQLVSLYYMFLGYDFWKYIEFNFSVTVLLIFSLLFFMLAIFYYKTGFIHSQTGSKSILKILAYSFFYRSLYVVPLIMAIYKIIQGDLRWYTK